MGTNAVNPAILDLMRRARGYVPNMGQTPPQPQMPDANQIPTQSPQSSGSPDELPFRLQNTLNASVDKPQEITPRDQALSSYRQAMQEPAPSISDYHPSIGKRILGALLGGASAFDSNYQSKSPTSQLGHDTVYGPFDKSMSDYQKKLAQKKEAFETENKSELDESKIGEQTAQKQAEVARAGAEEARRKGEEWKVSPEGLKAKTDQLKIQYPDARYNKPPTPYTLKLKNGENVVGYEASNGQFKDGDGNIYGPDAIENAFKVGTEPKDPASKPPREGEAGYIDQWTKEHDGRAPSTKELENIHKKYTEEGRRPITVSTDPGFKEEMQMNNARQSANKIYQTQYSQASSHLDKIDQAKMEIAKGTPESIALAVPNVLTALVSGQGTGVRITQPEMNSILKARGWGDSLQAFISRISGQGALSAKQKQDLQGVLDDVRYKVIQKQKRLSDTMDKIDTAKNPGDISKAHIEYRKGDLGTGTDSALPGGITLDDINAEIEKRKKK